MLIAPVKHGAVHPQPHHATLRAIRLCSFTRLGLLTLERERRAGSRHLGAALANTRCNPGTLSNRHQQDLEIEQQRLVLDIG
jgi:hypothetical protein